MQLVHHEVEQLRACFRRCSEGYSPEFTFVVVQKRINTRIYALLSGKPETPPPGTVIDYHVTRRHW